MRNGPKIAWLMAACDLAGANVFSLPKCPWNSDTPKFKTVPGEELAAATRLVQKIEGAGIGAVLKSGSLLGALRHHGPIPGDWDMDLCVPGPQLAGRREWGGAINASLARVPGYFPRSVGARYVAAIIDGTPVDFIECSLPETLVCRCPFAQTFARCPVRGAQFLTAKYGNYSAPSTKDLVRLSRAPTTWLGSVDALMAPCVPASQARAQDRRALAAFRSADIVVVARLDGMLMWPVWMNAVGCRDARVLQHYSVSRTKKRFVLRELGHSLCAKTLTGWTRVIARQIRAILHWARNVHSGADGVFRVTFSGKERPLWIMASLTGGLRGSGSYPSPLSLCRCAASYCTGDKGPRGPDAHPAAVAHNPQDALTCPFSEYGAAGVAASLSPSEHFSVSVNGAALVGTGAPAVPRGAVRVTITPAFTHGFGGASLYISCRRQSEPVSLALAHALPQTRTYGADIVLFEPDTVYNIAVYVGLANCTGSTNCDKGAALIFNRSVASGRVRTDSGLDAHLSRGFPFASVGAPSFFRGEWRLVRCGGRRPPPNARPFWCPLELPMTVPAAPFAGSPVWIHFVGASLMRNLYTQGVARVLGEHGPLSESHLGNGYGDWDKKRYAYPRHRFLRYGAVRATFTWFCGRCNTGDLDRAGGTKAHLGAGLAWARSLAAQGCPTVIVANYGLHHAHEGPALFYATYTKVVRTLVAAIADLCPESKLLWQFTEAPHYSTAHPHARGISITDTAGNPHRVAITHPAWNCRSEDRVFGLNQAAKATIETYYPRVGLIDTWAFSMSQPAGAPDGRHYKAHIVIEQARVLLAEMFMLHGR